VDHCAGQVPLVTATSNFHDEGADLRNRQRALVVVAVRVVPRGCCWRVVGGASGTDHRAGSGWGTVPSTSAAAGSTCAVAAPGVWVRIFDNAGSRCWRTQTSGRRPPSFKIYSTTEHN
jgi:hypothetical protein